MEARTGVQGGGYIARNKYWCRGRWGIYLETGTSGQDGGIHSLRQEVVSWTMVETGSGVKGG